MPWFGFISSSMAPMPATAEMPSDGWREYDKLFPLSAPASPPSMYTQERYVESSAKDTFLPVVCMSHKEE